MIASCSYLGENHKNCSEEEVEMSRKVDMLGVDWRRQPKKKRGGQIFAHQENYVFQERHIRIEVRKLLKMGMVSAPRERGEERQWALRRQKN